MKNLILSFFLFSVFIFTGCNHEEMCSPYFVEFDGSFALQCCDNGMFRKSAVCKCIDDYNKENGTDYRWIGTCD